MLYFSYLYNWGKLFIENGCVYFLSVFLFVEVVSVNV